MATDLTHWTFSDLELLKSHLDSVRSQIVAIQNSRSPLLCLPGELRNKILLLAMRADVLSRCRSPCCPTSSPGNPRPRCTSATARFHEPAFFRTCRQLRAEGEGVWYARVAVWEEWAEDDTITPDFLPDAQDGKGCRIWRTLRSEEVRALCAARSSVGMGTLVTQPCHTMVGTARAAVEESRSSCPRRGMARLEVEGCPPMKWWVW